MLKKLISTYNDLKTPVKAAAWFVVCGFFQRGIALLTTPVFTRIMTDFEYGRYSVYHSWLSIVEIIISLNLAGGVYSRGLVKNESDQNRFSSSILGLSTTCILAWTLIYAVFHDLFNSLLDLSPLLMAAMFLEIWASAAYGFWSSRERVNYRYRKLVAITFSYVLLRPLLGIFFVLHVSESHQAEARILTAIAVNLVLFSPLYISMTVKGRQFFNRDYWIYALKFNIPLVPHYLSHMLLDQLDRLMIKDICGPEQTAYYSVACTLAMGLRILNSSVAGTMNPWIYKSLRDGKEDRIGKFSYYILILIGAGNFLVIAVAPELLHVLAPSSYQSALWAIPPITASVFFMFLYNLFATFEYYYEKTQYVMTASLMAAVANIVLNAIFIRLYGFVAAGYTTLACYILYACGHYYFMRKVLKQFLGGKKIYNAKFIFGIGAALTGGSFLMMLFYNHIVIRYLILCACVAVLFRKRKIFLDVLAAMKKK